MFFQLLRRQIFLDVGLVFGGQDHVMHSGALGGQNFFFDSAHGSTFPLSVISPVIAVRGRTGRSVSSETRAVAMVTPAEGPSFGIAPAGT